MRLQEDSAIGGFNRMNQIVIRWAAAVLLYSPFLPSLAQSGATQKDAITTVCGEAVGDRMGFRSGAPFAAAWNYTTVTRKADGTTFTQTSPAKISRDSDGRTYFEQRASTSGSVHEVGPPSFWVSDPVKHISFFWWPVRKVVSLHHDPAPDTAEYEKLRREAPWVETIWEVPLCVAFDTASQYEGGQYHKEMLGTKMILGITAEGIRATRVLPAGYKGYDESVTITEERWYSTELQITLVNVVDDPRIGKGTWELTSLERAEPNPALFRLPTGYAINDLNAAAAQEDAAKVTKPARP